MQSNATLGSNSRNLSATVKVCMGGTKIEEFPIQVEATHDTLRNIYCGHMQLPQSDLDNYNKLTREINNARYHTTREFLLNQRHRGFVAAMYAQRDRVLAQQTSEVHV